LLYVNSIDNVVGTQAAELKAVDCTLQLQYRYVNFILWYTGP